MLHSTFTDRAHHILKYSNFYPRGERLVQGSPGDSTIFHLLELFLTSCTCTVNLKKGGFSRIPGHKSPSEKGLWIINLTLFAVLNGLLVRFCIKSGK